MYTYYSVRILAKAIRVRLVYDDIMFHGPLICRGCFTEPEIESVSDQASTEIVCPNCGSESFGI